MQSEITTNVFGLNPIPLAAVFTYVEPEAYVEQETPREEISEAQFALAYQTGFPKTARFLRARGMAPDVAEEMAQAAWARGWEYRGQLREVKALPHWVISIAKNLMRVSFRNKRIIEEIQEETVRIHPDTDGLLVSQLLKGLSNSDRSLLFETYAEGCSSTELAPRLGISPISVRVRVSRLKSSLRETLGLPN